MSGSVGKRCPSVPGNNSLLILWINSKTKELSLLHRPDGLLKGDERTKDLVDRWVVSCYEIVFLTRSPREDDPSVSGGHSLLTRVDLEVHNLSRREESGGLLKGDCRPSDHGRDGRTSVPLIHH